MFSTTVLASSFLSAILHSMVRFQAAEAESFTSHKLCTLLRRLPFKFETVMQIMMPCTLWAVLWISIPFTSGIFLVFIASSLVWILPFDCKAFSFWFGVGVFFPFHDTRSELRYHQTLGVKQHGLVSLQIRQCLQT